MRIAIFAETFLPKLDGVVNTLCYLLEYLEKNGHEALMFAPEGGPERYAGTKVVGLKAFPFPWYPELRLVPPLISVRDELADFQPDVLHLINPASLGIMGLWYGKSMHVPVVASYQTDIPGYAVRWGMPYMKEPLWAYFRWLHNQADLNLAPSMFTQTELMDQGFERVHVWSRGIDTQRFSPQHHTQEMRDILSGGEPEKKLLLYVGRLAIEKRVEMLLPVLQTFPDIRLAIVGGGPEEENLKELFRDMPVVFAGYLKGEELSQAYASADLFVFTGANETFGNVVLEAMASGLAVIVPRAGGVTDFVHDGQNGLLFDTESTQSLVDAVRRLIDCPEVAHELVTNALDYAYNRDWDSVFDGLIEEYANLIETYKENNRHEPLDLSQLFSINK